MKKCSKLPATLPAKQSKQTIIRTISFFAIMLLVTVLPGKLFAAVPAITSFSPATGAIGTLITINGANLNNPTALTIGGRSAIVISNTGSALVAMVMPGTGAGKVSITTAGGTASGSGNFTVTATPFPSAQEGSKLVGSGSVGKVSQGISASLSSDGNTALIGGPDDNTGRGAAWVYTRSGGIWTQQGTKLVGTGSVADAGEGLSVSLSADGNTALIGGYQDNYPAGAAWVFTRSGGIWTQQGTKLVGTGGAGATQGRSVSLSADGNTAIVGGPNDSSDVGAAWVYTRSDGVWTQQGTKLVGTGSAGGAFQGVSVSLSADGNMALVGGSFDNSGTGAVWVFTRSGGIWTQQGTKLVGTGSAGAAGQGNSVSLSADGNTAIAGGPSDNSNAGAAWIYIRSGGTWAQQGSKLVGSGSIGLTSQGECVSLSADGNTAIVGGNNDNTNVGAVWVYTRNNGAWTQKGSKLVGTGAIRYGLQGSSVALSADGSTAMEGGYEDNSDQGAAWAFIAVSANASLSTIALTPAFTLTNTGTVGSTTTYTTAVGANTSSVTVTPTTQDPGATVTVNGTAVASGTASAPVPLPEGANTTINTIVTAADGITTRTYSIIATRPPSTNTSLRIIALTPASALVNTGTVGTTVSYTTTAGANTSSVTVTPTAVDPTATITVDGIPVTTGTPSGPIPLPEGANTTINTVVTSPDGTTTKTYSIIVTRPPSTNTSLSIIALTPASTLVNTGTSGNTVTYTTSVSNATASVTVTPTAVDPTATITVNGIPVATGTASGPVALAEGTTTTINTVVTSPDGTTTKTYSITVTRAPSPNASLGIIALTPASTLINAGTSGGTTTYTTTAANATASVTVTPVAQDPNATITVNGTAVTSGTASGPVALTEGTNTTITTVVTAQDGTTTHTYTIIVTRAPSGNAALNAIVLSPFSLLTNTGTVGGTTTYTTSVTNAIASVTVTPTSVDPNAAITVNGTAVLSATASGSIALAAGATTTIHIVVRAQDGTTTRTYAIVVTRLNPNTLDNLGLTSSTPAAGAYSLRVLSSSYNRPLLRITIGTNYYDVYPDASKAKIFSLNSPISAAYTRYNAPATAATTNLLSSVITGNTATVAIWYDQSGNGYDAIQPDPGTQPEIASGGTIDVTNALPTIKFSGVNYLVVTSTAFNNDLSGSVVFNATSANNTSGTPDAWYTMNGIFGSEQPFAVNDFGYGILNNKFTAGNGPADNSVGGATVVDDGTTRINSWTRTNSSGTIALYAAGLNDGSATLNSGSRDAVPSVAIGAITTTGGGDFNGTLSEITMFPIVYTLAQRQTIEGNQETYYGIAAAVNASLATIALTPASKLINSGTSGSTTTYTTTAANATASVTVTPVTQDPEATVTVNGIAVTSGTASGPIALTVGADVTINTVVTARDGITTKTYTIIVTRAPSSNALLSTIKLTPASTLTNTGTTGTATTYTTSVGNATTSVTVTPAAQDANATVTVNGTAVTSGTASGSIALIVGVNTITTVVTAQDGTTTHTYSITVTRATGPLMSLYMPASVVQPTDNLGIENDGVTVHQGVSPNGDGINDFLTIDGIIAYPDNSLQIIDRNGALIYQAKGYNNISKVFDGHSGITGRMLQPGTYFYSLDYIADGQNKHKTGFIMLKY